MASVSFFAVVVLSHVTYFNRGEHHLYGVKYLQLFSISAANAIALLTYTGDIAVSQATSRVFVQAAWLLAGLLMSLLINRAFLSPLKRFLAYC